MEQSLQTNDQDRQECPLTDIVKLDAPLNELLQKVASTAEILVYKQQNININAQWKDWALEMLMAGYETENLFILAGEDIHCNPFEFAELTDKIFEELHLNEIDSNSIIILYSLYNDQAVAVIIYFTYFSLFNWLKYFATHPLCPLFRCYEHHIIF